MSPHVHKGVSVNRREFLGVAGGVGAGAVLLGAGFVEDRGIDNFVVLTGDVHANWTNDLRRDFERPETPLLGSEFVCTSVTSNGDGSGSTNPGRLVWDENPHTKYYSDRRGYVHCTVSRDQWVTDYRVVDYVRRPDAPIRTDRSFVIEAGVPGVRPL